VILYSPTITDVLGVPIFTDVLEEDQLVDTIPHTLYSSNMNTSEIMLQALDLSSYRRMSDSSFSKEKEHPLS